MREKNGGVNHLVAPVDDAAALHCKRAMAHAKIVRNFAIVGYIEDGKVCEFANFERADAVVAA